MNKFLFLIFFYFLCSSTIANAGIDEAGSGNWCQKYNKAIKLAEENQKNKIKKNKKYSMIYAACETDGWTYGSYFGNNLEKLKKKTYKKCMKRAKKFNLKDCYIFSLNGEVLWQKKYDWDKGAKRAKLLPDKESTSCYNRVAIPLILESDKKPGRFFEDQPDVNDDYQIHIVYSLLKDSKDKEGDINGAIEKWIQASDKYILRTTKKANKRSDFKNGIAQNIKWDRRKDGKLDISFIRINKTKNELKKSKYGSCENVFGRTIINAGFNNPKKIYFNFGDYSFKDWPYSAGFPIFNIFAKHQYSNTLKKSEFGYLVLHEALHSMGGIFTCSPKHFEGHNTKKTSDLMSRQGDGRNNTLDPKNDDYWGHENKNCPDMQDSVYFTPTSDTPYDPFEVTCLPKEKWKLTKHDYKNIKDRRGEGEMCFYARSDVFAQWEKELGIFQK